MGKKGAKRKTRWRTLSIGTPPGEEDEEDGSSSSQRNGYVKSDHQRSPTHYAGKERNGYHQHNNSHHHQQQPWLKSRHGSAGSSSNGGSSSGYASGESRNVASYNEDEYTKITTPRQDMLFKKGYLSQRKQLHASASATPSTAESQSASHSTADGSEAAEDQQLLDSGAPVDYLATPGTTVLEAAPAQLSYGTYYDHASGYYYEYPMMLVGPALPPDQMHHGVPCAAVPCAPVPLRPIEWVNPAFVPKLASQQYCYMDYQTQGPDCAALVDAQGMPLSHAELPLTNGLSNETSLTGSASASASGSVADDVDESVVLPSLPMVDQEMTELVQPTQLHQQPPIEVIPLEVVEQQQQPEVIAMPMEYAPVEAPPYVEPQPMPYLYPGQYMFGPPVVNVNGVTIQSGPMLRCSDMVASSAAAAAAVAKRRKKKKKKKQKRPHALGNTEDEDEEDYSSEGDTALSSPSRVPWPAATVTVAETATTTTTTSWPLNPECQEFHFPEAANASMESVAEPQPQLSNDLTRLTSEDDRVDEAHEVIVIEEEQQQVEEEEIVKQKTRRRSLKIVREPTPGPDLRDDVVVNNGHEDENDEEEVAQEALLVDERPVEEVTAMLVSASIVETPRKDADVDAHAWHNESSITSESCCAASRITADETDSGFESQQSSGKSRPITDAVNEWLKRANSPDLFITSSATSDEEEEDEVEEYDDQSKNLQGNPMPALSVNGQASHEQLAAVAATAVGGGARKHRGKKKTQRRKRDQSEQCGKRDLAQETADHSVRATDDPPGTTATSAELSVNKDSDAGMRVAEKTRITKLEDTSATQQQQSVKTYEKGEIVVSMDGELLLVETIVPTRRESSSSESMGASLGSIEEPDLVLECWEPETVEPIVATPKKTLEEDALSLAEDKQEESMGHVQRYYRLIEDEVVEPAKAVAPTNSDEEEEEEDSSEEEVVEVVVTPDKCISFDPKALLPPVDEAFEVYESCYNGGKSLPYEHRSPFYSGDPSEGPIPCKANCCNVQ